MARLNKNINWNFIKDGISSRESTYIMQQALYKSFPPPIITDYSELDFNFKTLDLKDNLFMN